MSFKLIIDIRGLCLLVPHDGKLHVLLPATASHAGMEHVACFKFKGGRPEEKFDGVRWDLSGIGGSFDGTIPPVVADAAEYIRKDGLPLSQLRPGMQREVSSHLILGAGRCTAHGRVAHWKIGGDSMVRMTNKIRWVIDSVPDAELAWEFEALSGPGRTPDPLVPQGGNRVVELDLMHAPEPEHSKPDDDGVCTPNNHFHMYWPLFPSTLGHHPACEPGAPVLPEMPFGSPPRFDGSPGFEKGPSVFTCMLAHTTKVDPTT